MAILAFIWTMSSVSQYMLDMTVLAPCEFVAIGALKQAPILFVSSDIMGINVNLRRRSWMLNPDGGGFCLWKASRFIETLRHENHSNGSLSLCCVNMCLLADDFRLNVRWQKSHENGRSPVWIIKCCWCRCLVFEIWSQSGHWYRTRLPSSVPIMCDSY